MALVANMAISDGTPLGVSVANFDGLRHTAEGMAVYLLGTFVRQMFDMAGAIPNVADLVRRPGAWGDHEAAMSGLLRMLARRHPGSPRHRFRDWFWWWLSLFGGITFGVAVWGPALDYGDDVLHTERTGLRLEWDEQAQVAVGGAMPYPGVPFVANEIGPVPRRVAEIVPRVNLDDRTDARVAAAVASIGPLENNPRADNPRYGPEGLGGRGSALRHQIRTVEAGVQPSSRLYER